MNIAQLQEQCHAMSASKGWHEDPACQVKYESGAPPVGVDYDRVATLIALIHSEASEALEELRKGEGHLGIYYTTDKNGADKPEGFVVELADVIIRVLDTAGALGLPLQRAVEQKMAYNKLRPHRHGDKRL